MRVALVALAIQAGASGATTRLPTATSATEAIGNPSPVSTDTTWYVTNRARQGGRLVREFADSLEYGFVVRRFREPGVPDPGMHFVERIDAERVDSARLDREEFVKRIRALDSAAARSGTGAILYVHGYAVSHGRGIIQGSEIAHRGDHSGPIVVFSWPAHASLVSWPSRSALLTRAYRDDRAAAMASAQAFRAAVSTLQSALRPGSLTIVGHSLGAQLVAEALATPGSLRDSLTATPLSALVFFAPDIGTRRLGDTLATALTPLADRRVVYASDRDWLLSVSRLMNRTPRAGRASAARGLTPSGFEVVDITLGRRTSSPLLKIVEPRHAMRFASAALYDFFGVVRGVPAACRSILGIATRDSDGTWRLSGGPLPAGPAASPPAETRCGG